MTLLPGKPSSICSVLMIVCVLLNGYGYKAKYTKIIVCFCVYSCEFVFVRVMLWICIVEKTQKNGYQTSKQNFCNWKKKEINMGSWNIQSQLHMTSKLSISCIF